MTFNGNSRFFDTPLISTRSGVETYGRVEGIDRIKKASGNNILMYLVESGYDRRPDLIASLFYGRPFLDWVIIAANSPKKILDWPVTGELIKIPTQSFVRSIL